MKKPFLTHQVKLQLLRTAALFTGKELERERDGGDPPWCTGRTYQPQRPYTLPQKLDQGK